MGSYRLSFWKAETVDSDAWVGQYTSLAVGKDGGIWICYYDETHGRLKAAHRGASHHPWNVWVVDQEEGVGGLGRHASLALGEDDTVWISYYDRPHKRLKVARRLPEGLWESEAVDDEGRSL